MSNRGDDGYRRRRHLLSSAPEKQQRRSTAERVAAETFVHLMQRNRIRHYELVATCHIRSVTRSSPNGPRNDVLHHYEPAPPFWPLTVNRGQAEALTGYGVDHDAICVRYERLTLPLTGYDDGRTAEVAVFGPECRHLLQRASAANPAFLSERLPPWHAVQVVGEYLLEAALSLAEGRGPLVVDHPSGVISD